MIGSNWVLKNHEEATKKLIALMEAIEPFAENPDNIDRLNERQFPCHAGLTTKERCGRCSRAIAAWKALHM